MKTITAPTITALEKAVNDFTFTNSAYRPHLITRTVKRTTTKASNDKPAAKPSTKETQTFTCLLLLSEDTRLKTTSLFHGTLEQLTASPLATIPTRSITHQQITPDENGKVFALIVQ